MPKAEKANYFGHVEGRAAHGSAPKRGRTGTTEGVFLVFCFAFFFLGGERAGG